MAEYQKRTFGEISVTGGLNSFKQTMRFKYLYPTRDYPQGKAVIELLVPEQINNILIPKDMLEKTNDQIVKLASLQLRTDNIDDKIAIGEQLKLLTAISEGKTKAKPFAVKSFRFTEKDYMATQNMLSHLGHLFGYLFCKYKMEIEQIGSQEHLMHARNALAKTNGENVAREFMEGFMDAYNEIDEAQLKKHREERLVVQ